MFLLPVNIKARNFDTIYSFRCISELCSLVIRDLFNRNSLLFVFTFKINYVILNSQWNVKAINFNIYYLYLNINDDCYINQHKIFFKNDIEEAYRDYNHRSVLQSYALYLHTPLVSFSGKMIDKDHTRRTKLSKIKLTVSTSFIKIKVTVPTEAICTLVKVNPSLLASASLRSKSFAIT